MSRYDEDLSRIRRHTAALEWRTSTRRTMLIFALIIIVPVVFLIGLGIIMRAMEPQGPTPTNPNYGR